MPRFKTARIFALAALLPLAACEVEQTEEGELPEAEDFNMPEYEVEGPDVDINRDTTTVVVPDVDINTPDDDEVR